MKVVIKNPNADPEIKDIPNTLEAFQEAVGGSIETIPTGFADLIMIVNEKGFIKDMPLNVEFNGYRLYGPVVFVAVEGDNFKSLEDYQVEIIMDALAENEIGAEK